MNGLLPILFLLHTLLSSRTRHGHLKIDGILEGEIQAAGQTTSIQVEPTFYLGNLLPETLRLNVVRNNLQVRKIPCKVFYVYQKINKIIINFNITIVCYKVSSSCIIGCD